MEEDIYPTVFPIEDNETIFQREDEILISSSWEENSDYWEETIVCKYPTGEILERVSGTMMEMPDKQNWIIGE